MALILAWGGKVKCNLLSRSPTCGLDHALPESKAVDSVLFSNVSRNLVKKILFQLRRFDVQVDGYLELYASS